MSEIFLYVDSKLMKIIIATHDETKIFARVPSAVKLRKMHNTFSVVIIMSNNLILDFSFAILIFVCVEWEHGLVCYFIIEKFDRTLTLLMFGQEFVL